MIQQFISKIGKTSLRYSLVLGSLAQFSANCGTYIFQRKIRIRHVLAQLEIIGTQSLWIICICALSVGAVFGLQVGGIFAIFKAEAILGAATGMALTRELAPIITATVLTGRAGSAMTAEISTMKVNEQIDAMEAMAVNPAEYIAVPRIIASIIATPLLTIFCIFMGMIGAYLVAVVIFSVDVGIFLTKLREFLVPDDIFQGLQKSVVFGATYSIVCCFYGLNASGGAKGVGEGTTNAVITTLLLLLFFDFIITYLQVVVRI